MSVITLALKITLKAYTDQMAVDINKMSQVVEDAVKELVRIFLHRAQLEQGMLLESEASTDRSETICKFKKTILEKSSLKHF